MGDIEIIHVTTQEEKEKCLQVRKEVFVKEQSCPIEEEIDEHDSSLNCNHFLALKNTQPIGTLRIYPYDDNTPKIAKIGRLSVLKEYRGKGIGALLLNKAESFARSQLGYEKCILHAQKYKSSWYENRGYKVLSDEIFYEAGIEHVKMRKDF
ncbi:acyl-CoA N-acyltransferase [Rhizophagus irregularis]|uniref:Glucosamine 6-phosphate N-acetyltransferase n=1 Tax=Rhizophagus irregularis TaxID=588596 RepID=A0A2N1N9X6_9GLOM|nr:acyl-CoA N-acyltransferase [Rhizophagus irregularis]